MLTRALEGVLQGLQLVGRQRLALAGGDVDREQGGQATVAVGGELAPHGIAVDTKQPGDRLARVRLFAGEEQQRVEAGALGRMPFLSKLGLQFVGSLSNGGHRLAHGSIQSAARVVTEGYRDHALCARPMHITTY